MREPIVRVREDIEIEVATVTAADVFRFVIVADNSVYYSLVAGIGSGISSGSIVLVVAVYSSIPCR